MSCDCDNACREYRELSRRHFLGLSASALAAALGPSWLPRVVYADSESSGRDVLVQVFLRGGADALSLCVPFAEDNYYRLRPTLAFGRPDSSDEHRVTALDERFGFPPPMTPLLTAWQDGALLVVHATGSHDPTRSHFDAMHFMEVGQPRPPVDLYTGWLGRHLATTAPSLADAVLRAVGIGFGLPRTLVGGPGTVPVPDLAEVGFAGNPGSAEERQERLAAMYAAVGDPLRTSAESTLRTIDLLETIDFAAYQPAGGAVYPEGELGYALKSTAALIRAEVGVEAVAIDAGGWDTHQLQLPQQGTMAALMRTLAEGFAAFHADLFASDHRNVVLVALTEFGRNVGENASRGTDHGHGSAMLVLGGNVRGGQVLTEWPGLDDALLYEGQDLAVTIDYRDVLTEIATRRLGNPDFRNLFPDPEYQPVDWGITA